MLFNPDFSEIFLMNNQEIKCVLRHSWWQVKFREKIPKVCVLFLFVSFTIPQLSTFFPVFSQHFIFCKNFIINSENCQIVMTGKCSTSQRMEELERTKAKQSKPAIHKRFKKPKKSWGTWQQYNSNVFTYLTFRNTELWMSTPKGSMKPQTNVTKWKTYLHQPWLDSDQKYKMSWKPIWKTTSTWAAHWILPGGKAPMKSSIWPKIYAKITRLGLQFKRPWLRAIWRRVLDSFKTFWIFWITQTLISIITKTSMDIWLKKRGTNLVQNVTRRRPSNAWFFWATWLGTNWNSVRMKNKKSKRHNYRKSFIKCLWRWIRHMANLSINWQLCPDPNVMVWVLPITICDGKFWVVAGMSNRPETKKKSFQQL